MMRSIVAAAPILLLVSAAWADPPLASDEHQEPSNAPYITGTGATVQNPGVPQASGPTKLDRKIQREDNKIDDSICKGC